jgi:hypothetical protein
VRQQKEGKKLTPPGAIRPGRATAVFCLPEEKTQEKREVNSISASVRLVTHFTSDVVVFPFITGSS